jgi:hypothetical protein
MRAFREMFSYWVVRFRNAVAKPGSVICDFSLTTDINLVIPTANSSPCYTSILESLVHEDCETHV